MTIIVDSGSTKSHWAIVKSDGTRSDIFSSGINPYYQTSDDIRQTILRDIHFEPDTDHCDIFFYGAGCANSNMNTIVRDAILAVFPDADCHIDSDMLGACRALFGNSNGIACILGTGSNSCRYDGHDIVENVSPLGFILGDEGSGAVIGKRFIGDLLKQQTTREIEQFFHSQYNLSSAQIVESVYRKTFPNRFLAQFSKFVSLAMDKLSDHDSIYYLNSLVESTFRDFFVRNVSHYPSDRVGFVGSVAYHFRSQLSSVADSLGYDITDIMPDPMNSLVSYHTA